MRLGRLAIQRRRPFSFQGVRGVCTTSSPVSEEEEKARREANQKIIGEDDEKALKKALAEHEETLARTIELGVDPSEGFIWLVDAGGKLDRELRGEHRIVKSGRQQGEVDTVRELMMATQLRVRDKRGNLRPLFLNRTQKEYARHCGQRNIVLKARQLGITSYVAARFFIHTITHPGTLSVQVAHDQQSAEEIFRIVHRFVENLPAPLRKGALRTSRANVRQIVFPCLDSEYRVETAADPNAGRGLTVQNLHCSEVARWPRDAAATLASLRAAVPPDGEIVLESTPNGAAGCFYDEWIRATDTGYTRHFFPWWWEPTYRREVKIADFNDVELALMNKHGLDAGQIAFRREMRANFGSRMAEEYAEDSESCFLASGDCFFDVEIIDRCMRQPRPVVEQRDNGRLLVFLPAMTGADGGTPKDYIIGVDPAGGGVDGDFACAQVIERGSGAQCAELQGHFTPEELAGHVAVIGHEYNNALLAVERNNQGYLVLSQLRMHIGYPNVYEQKGVPGWYTTAVTRPQMLAILSATLTHAPFLFSSIRLLEECRTFVRHPDGSISAANGTHDDLVMSMAVALAVRAEVAPSPAQREASVTVSSLQRT